MRSGPQASTTSIPKLLVVALLVLGIGVFIGQRSAVPVNESGESESNASGVVSDTVPTTGIAAASAKMPPPSLPGSVAQYYRSLAEGKPAAPEQESGQERAVSQDPPVADPVQSAGDTTEQEAVEQQDPPPTRRGAGERQGRRGNRPGRTGRGEGGRGAAARGGDEAQAVGAEAGAEGGSAQATEQTSGEGDEAASEGGRERSRGDRSEARRKKKPREGIPVHHPLIEERCVVCHVRDDEGKMTRISYMRKTPEAWEISIKRMVRLYFVSLTPEEAKETVRYLSEEHGLSHAEARAAMYETERRVHWSEEDQNEDLRETCADCHTLGRVFSERRDDEEWKLLKATHLALYPLVDFQSFQDRGRGRSRESSGEEQGGSSTDRSRQRNEDRADRVLAALAKEQPLFNDEWRSWNQEKREVPLEGRWIVSGHEVGRGDIHGTLDLKQTATGEYESQWRWRRADGRTVVRKGTGLFYAGHSWRGRSTSTAPGELESLREVLLLDESWVRMEGRLFTGEYNELGIEMELLRDGETPTILALQGAEMAVPCEGNTFEVLGCGFPEDLAADDFHLGKGLTVTAAERHDDTHVTLRVDVAAKTPLGKRAIDFRIHHGPSEITLYDTIDGIRIRPNPGFSRVGGKMRPKQLERFEAVAFHRGPDGVPYNEDDVELMMVPVKWHLEEFPIRPGDDDIQFVGELDEETGVFTPGIDGPNPERRFNANNIGDVYVVATCTLTVPERKEVKKEQDEDSDEDSDGDSDEDSDEDSHDDSDADQD
ncbi:MAG: quinohemoprotein amine dehydrogenase subunit alpha, partial [Planctomycetota bacterium]